MDIKLNKKIEKNILTIIKMLGYIISHKREINVKEHKIISFDILHKTNLNIFVVDNNGVLYINDIIHNASWKGHVEILKWFKNSGYEFKYSKNAFIWASFYENIEVLKWFKNNNYKFKYDNNIFMTKNIKIIYFLKETIHHKKIVKYSYPIKSMKFKTKNNYIKGYNKN